MLSSTLKICLGAKITGHYPPREKRAVEHDRIRHIKTDEIKRLAEDRPDDPYAGRRNIRLLLCQQLDQVGWDASLVRFAGADLFVRNIKGRIRFFFCQFLHTLAISHTLHRVFQKQCFGEGGAGQALRYLRDKRLRVLLLNIGRDGLG
jgi:hypothetical protein